MQTISITDHTGAVVQILPGKGATVVSYRVNGQEVFYRDQENLDSDQRPRCGVPFLFPAFGRTPEGGTYPMLIHGFGHTSSWEVVSQEPSQLRLALMSTEQTRSFYPFRFRVELTFSLEEGRLRICQKYENLGGEEMRYSYGFHPYFLVEDPEKTEVSVCADLEIDMRTGNAVPCEKTTTTVCFREGAEETGAMFLQVRDSAVIDTGSRRIKMTFDSSFDRLVLWAVRGKPFLCVEPINSSPNGLTTGDCYTLLPGKSRQAEISFEILK